VKVEISSGARERLILLSAGLDLRWRERGASPSDTLKVDEHTPLGRILDDDVIWIASYNHNSINAWGMP
jgi:hypothetical protein